MENAIIEAVIRSMVYNLYKDASINDIAYIRDKIYRFWESFTTPSNEELYLIVFDEGLNVIKYITHLDVRPKDIEIAICAKGKSIKDALQSVIQSLDECIKNGKINETLLLKTATKNF